MGKKINIRNKVVNRVCDVFYFDLKEEVKLKEQLSKLLKEGIFDKYQMTYVYRFEEDKIVLVLHPQFDLIAPLSVPME